MAPSAPRPADRRTTLTSATSARSSTSRALTLAFAAVLVAGCSSDDVDSGGSVTVAPNAEDETAGSSSTAADELASTDGGLDEEPVHDSAPARDAGVVDAPAGLTPEGFTTATVRVTAADGTTCDVCVWLADTADERSRGLMGVTDLAEPVGMLFRFDAPTTGNFFMFGTPMPLSIAWFGADGTHVAQTDMEPCLVDDSVSCERYGPGAEYVDAVEMVQGELDVIGIGPGSSLEVLAEHETCPEFSS